MAINISLKIMDEPLIIFIHSISFAFGWMIMSFCLPFHIHATTELSPTSRDDYRDFSGYAKKRHILLKARLSQIGSVYLKMI